MKEHAAHKICSSLEWSKMVPEGFPLIINHPRWIHWRPCPLWCWLGRPWKCKYSWTSPTLQSRRFGKRKSSIWHTHPHQLLSKHRFSFRLKLLLCPILQMDRHRVISATLLKGCLIIPPSSSHRKWPGKCFEFDLSININHYSWPISYESEGWCSHATYLEDGHVLSPRTLHSPIDSWSFHLEFIWQGAQPNFCLFPPGFHPIPHHFTQYFSPFRGLQQS